MSSFYHAGFCGQGPLKPEDAWKATPDTSPIAQATWDAGLRTTKRPDRGRGKTKYHILSKNSAMCPPSRAVVPFSSLNLHITGRRAPRDR